MRIVLAGGGTGGHFYPLIAIAEAVYEEAEEEKLVSEPELYFLAPTPYDQEALDEHDIAYRKVSAGKKRTHATLKNIWSYIKIAIGSLKALWTLFVIYPDVVFAKGGYASFPVLLAARTLQIPVVIHESDSIPGRVNRWAGSFAEKIAVSFPQASKFFPKEKTAVTGNPVRSSIAEPAMTGAREYLEIPTDVPVVFIIGGSQGSQAINGVVLSALPELLEDFYVIHQTGPDNIESVKQTTDILFDDLSSSDQSLAERYKPFGFLEAEALRMAAGAADVVVSRAGSIIFEIAAWTVPSILIPFDHAHEDHQRENAYTYARTGAATVIEEKNLSDDILMATLREITDDADKYQEMVEAAADFYRPDSSSVIARELIHISKRHS